MKYTVLSKADAQELSHRTLKSPIVIISVTSINSQQAVFRENRQIKDVLRLSFNDVDGKALGAMSQSDAEKIVEFCNKWYSHCDLVVHCEAGISRSAGISAAIMKWFENDDLQIFSDPYYRPNMHCYREVLKAFERANNN